MTDPGKDNSQLQPKRKLRGWQRTFGQLLQHARSGEDLKLAADVPDQIVKQPDGSKRRRAKTNVASIFAQLEGLKERFVGIPKRRLASVPKQLQRLKKLRAAGQDLQQDDVDWLIDVVEECSWLMDVVDEFLVLPVRKGRKRNPDLTERRRWLAWGRKRLRELKAQDHSAGVAMSIVVRELKKQRCFDNWSSNTFADRLRRKSD